MNTVMDKLKNTKLLGIIGNALIILGVVLPMVSTPFGSFSLLSLEDLGRKLGGSGMGYGILLIIIAILNLIIIFGDKIVAAVPGLSFLEKICNQKYTIGTTIVAGIFLIIDISPMFGIVPLAIGFWILLLGLVASVVYPLIYKGDTSNSTN